MRETFASPTDWRGGYLARRRKQVTALGQVMDPLADKLLISAALISLVQLDLATAWMVAIIIGREFAVTGLRTKICTQERNQRQRHVRGVISQESGKGGVCGHRPTQPDQRASGG